MKRLLALAVAPLALLAFAAPQAKAQAVIVRPAVIAAPAPVLVPAPVPGFGAFYSTPVGNGRLSIGIGNSFYPPVYVAPRIVPAPVYYPPYPYTYPRPLPPHYHHHDHHRHHR